MRNLRLFCALFVALAIVACSSGPQYTTDFAPEADFSKYRTYAWHPDGGSLPDDPRYDNSLVVGSIKSAVDHGISVQTNLRKVDDPETADILVVYHGVTQEQTSYTTVNSYYGYSPYWGGYGRWGGWGMGVGGGTTYVNNYDKGTLIIDLLENVPGDEERIVWRSSITNTVREAGEPRATLQELRQVGERLFEGYPGS